MFASEIMEHCGIGAWTANSHVVHAVSETPGGSYRRLPADAGREVFPVFSHEPNLARAPSGEYVLYFTANDPANHTVKPGCHCVDGTSGPSCAQMPWGTAPTWMSWTKPAPGTGRPDGPWSKPVRLFEAEQAQIDADTNLAVVILGNGSVVGLARTGTKRNGIAIHLVTAAHWKDPAAYTGRWHEDLFPDLRVVPPAGLEDPFVWVGRDGVFHAIFHNQIENDDERLAGGHAWSENGRNWTFSGTAFNNTVTFDDGGTFVFSRMERPHLIFGDPKDPFSPTHITTGVQYGDGNAGGDACRTLLQPIFRG